MGGWWRRQPACLHHLHTTTVAVGGVLVFRCLVTEEYGLILRVDGDIVVGDVVGEGDVVA